MHLPEDNREAIYAIHTQTVTLANQLGQIGETLREIREELVAERHRNEARLERLAERQRMIILFLSVGMAVVGTVALGPERLIGMLLR